MALHKDRMQEMASALPSPDMVRAFQRNQNQMPSHAKRKARKQWERVQTYARAVLQNGAGLLVDQELRLIFDEYNHRLVEHGLLSMPTSFNVMEAFFRYDKRDNFFYLRPEHDHLFSISDFIDFVTSSDAPQSPVTGAYQFPEGDVFSYSLYDDPHDLTFTAGTGREVAIGGVSFVRHGDELSVFLAAGQVADLSAESEKIIAEKPKVMWSKNKRIRPADDLKSEAACLGQSDDLWKTLALCRLNLKQSTDDVRYVLLDHGNSYIVVTDDPAIYEPTMGQDEVDAQLKRMQPELRKYAVLFELARTCLFLPAYFNFKLTMVRSERMQTRFARQKGRDDFLSHREREIIPASAQVAFRQVSALRIVNPEPTRIARRFSAPLFQVEVNGFWRRLSAGKMGRDLQGVPIEGKTWVKAHRRWRDLPEKTIEVLVKSRVSIARAIVAAEKLVKAVDDALPVETQLHTANQATTKVTREEAYRQRRLLTTRLRWRIMQRDQFRCCVCGADAAVDRDVRLDVDHTIPVSQGGLTAPENLRTLCSKCNNGKGDLLS